MRMSVHFNGRTYGMSYWSKDYVVKMKNGDFFGLEFLGEDRYKGSFRGEIRISYEDILKIMGEILLAISEEKKEVLINIKK